MLTTTVHTLNVNSNDSKHAKDNESNPSKSWHYKRLGQNLLSFTLVAINHSHEYKDRILPQRVFPLLDWSSRRDTRNHLWTYAKGREDKTLEDVIQTFIRGSKTLQPSSTRTYPQCWLSSRDSKNELGVNSSTQFSTLAGSGYGSFAVVRCIGFMDGGLLLREYILPHIIYPLHLLKWGHITQGITQRSHDPRII